MLYNTKIVQIVKNSVRLHYFCKPLLIRDSIYIIYKIVYIYIYICIFFIYFYKFSTRFSRGKIFIFIYIFFFFLYKEIFTIYTIFDLNGIKWQNRRGFKNSADCTIFALFSALFLYFCTIFVKNIANF